jgi:uncharacterized membrane protein YheB (UPF0754 family)
MSNRTILAAVVLLASMLPTKAVVAQDLAAVDSAQTVEFPKFLQDYLRNRAILNELISANIEEQARLERLDQILKENRASLEAELNEVTHEALTFEMLRDKAFHQIKASLEPILKAKKPSAVDVVKAQKAYRDTINTYFDPRLVGYDERVNNLADTIEKRSAQLAELSQRMEANLELKRYLENGSNQNWENVKVKFLEAIRKLEGESLRIKEIRDYQTSIQIPRFEAALAQAAADAEQYRKDVLRAQLFEQLKGGLLSHPGLSVSTSPSSSSQVLGSGQDGTGVNTECGSLALCVWLQQ